MKLTEVNVKLEPRTPTHIKGDEVRKPFVDIENNNIIIYTLRELENIEIADLLNNISDIISDTNNFVKRFMEKSEKISAKGVDPKRFREISLFIRDGNGRRFLPGTSVKGSIRTAVFYELLLKSENAINAFGKFIKKVGDELHKNWGSSTSKSIFENYLRNMLGITPNNDPFRAVTVVDSYFDGNSTFEAIKAIRKGARKGVDKVVEFWTGGSANVTLLLDPDLWIYLWKRIEENSGIIIPDTIKDINSAEELVGLWTQSYCNMLTNYRNMKGILRDLAYKLKKEVTWHVEICNVPSEKGYVVLGGFNGWLFKTIGFLIVNHTDILERAIDNIVRKHPAGKDKRGNKIYTIQGFPFPKTYWCVNDELPGIVKVEVKK